MAVDTRAKGVMPRDRAAMTRTLTGENNAISAYDKDYFPLTFPLLFPQGGEPGWHLSMKSTTGNKITLAQWVTQLLVREPRFQQLGPLVNEFLIDVFSCIEDQRLTFHAHNQDKYRTSLHHNSAISRIPRSLTTTSAPADRVIIPSSFSGGFADQAKKLTEAMAILRHFGPPSYFVTATCNTEWPEIKDNLHAGRTAFDRAELCARVFKQKLDVLQQKRGLPQSHIMFQVCDEHRPDNAVCIDKHIRATWPHREQEPALYDIVNKFMTHKNCKTQRRLCYVEGRKQCKKRFPKPPQLTTTFDERGYPLYRRSDDDTDIVPYNDKLLLLFDAHINVEVSATVNIVSYMFAPSNLRSTSTPLYSVLPPTATPPTTPATPPATTTTKRMTTTISEESIDDNDQSSEDDE